MNQEVELKNLAEKTDDPKAAAEQRLREVQDQYLLECVRLESLKAKRKRLADERRVVLSYRLLIVIALFTAGTLVCGLVQVWLMLRG